MPFIPFLSYFPLPVSFLSILFFLPIYHGESITASKLNHSSNYSLTSSPLCFTLVILYTVNRCCSLPFSSIHLHPLCCNAIHLPPTPCFQVLPILSLLCYCTVLNKYIKFPIHAPHIFYVSGSVGRFVSSLYSIL